MLSLQVFKTKCPENLVYSFSQAVLCLPIFEKVWILNHSYNLSKSIQIICVKHNCLQVVSDFKQAFGSLGRFTLPVAILS
jgi:hypothetical protein